MVLAVRSKRESCLNVLRGEFRKIRKDICSVHARREPAQHVINGDAHVPDARLATTFPGFDGDAWVERFHEGRVLEEENWVKVS